MCMCVRVLTSQPYDSHPRRKPRPFLLPTGLDAVVSRRGWLQGACSKRPRRFTQLIRSVIELTKAFRTFEERAEGRDNSALRACSTLTTQQLQPRARAGTTQSAFRVTLTQHQLQLEDSLLLELISRRRLAANAVGGGYKIVYQ